jgi:membrane protein
MGAALAYYLALSLAPTLLILLAITSWAVGTQAATSRFLPQLQDLVGYEGANAIQTMIEGSHQASKGVAPTVFGLVTVFFAASAVVSELRDSMNTIWRVPQEKASGSVRSIVNDLKDRISSFALVLAAGLFLVASLIVNTWIITAGKVLNAGTSLPAPLVQITDWVVSFVVITVVLASIYKVLPRVPLRWSDVAPGAVGTALLFVAGKVLLGLYLGNAGFSNMYGAAGSLVIVLVWVYYSAQLLYLGAEFTRAYTHRYGSILAPKNDHSGL